jgi:phage FluMu protein Com
MICAKSGKFTEKLRDMSQYVNVKCYYCLSISRRHVQTQAVTQVVKLLRAFRGPGRLITLCNGGTYLCQLNSACTVTHYFFMSHFNISFCLNTYHPFALPIGVPNKSTSLYLLNTLSHNGNINNNGAVE